MNKNRVSLTESQLRRIVKESVDSILKEERPISKKKKDNKINESYSAKTGRAKRELGDALLNVKGVINKYIEEEFDCFTKSELEDISDFCDNMYRKISDSWNYGPYEGEPYHFGSY